MVLTFEASIDLNKISESGQCFRWSQIDDDMFEIIAHDRILTVKQLTDTKIDLNCTEEEYEKIWKDYFDVKTDYSIFDELITSDDLFLQEAYKTGKGIRILKQDPWETLISFLISQQKNIPAIKSTIEKLSAIYGRPLGNSRFTFPTPQEIVSGGIDRLEECRLGYRHKYIKSAVELLYENPNFLSELNTLNDSELRKKLTSIYGVGPKIANCIMLFSYNRLDSFPVDVWIKRALEKEYDQAFDFSRYRPYNGIIQQYIFYYYRNKKEA